MLQGRSSLTSHPPGSRGWSQHLEAPPPLCPSPPDTPSCSSSDSWECRCGSNPGVERCHVTCRMTESGLHQQISLGAGAFRHFWIFVHPKCESGNSCTHGSTKNALGERWVWSTQCWPWTNLPQAGVKSRREQRVGVWGVRGWRDFCTTVSITPVNTHLLRPPTSIKCSMSQIKAPPILQATTPPPRLRVTEGNRKFLKLQASFPQFLTVASGAQTLPQDSLPASSGGCYCWKSTVHRTPEGRQDLTHT